ncbi:AAA family ATPase [Leucobacter chinensis]|uniref:AAA family ATPase n=1 Tax=Leucobacter chinensis TaxID=2851010 RepID=UPI0020B886D2|nr:AAA family ATPase [Leucobacter chinensis]
MVSDQANPVLLEALELAEALRVIRRAAVRDHRTLSGHTETPEHSAQLRTAIASALKTTEAISHTQATEVPHAPFAEPVREHLRELADTAARWNTLWRDHHGMLAPAFDAHLAALRQAIALHKLEDASRARSQGQDEVRQLAAASDRVLTPAERHRLASDVPRATSLPKASESAHTLIAEAANPEAVARALGQITLKRAANELSQGLLVTDQMRDIITEAVPVLHRGDPLLLIGETGGAKTALAEHLARTVVAGEPEFVSGYGDITSAQVIGTHELRAVDGATLTEFVPGPLVRAMTLGKPIILDEINAMPPEFLKRLNRILQLGPGDLFSVQENAGAQVRIAEGFVILATANEQSRRRYRGIEQLSAELVNRFGANTFRVLYPDAQRSFHETPTENLLLASTAASGPDGRLLPGMSSELLERVARVAFVSQQVFAGSQAEGFRDYVSTEHAVDGRPGLEESVIAPRTLVSIVRKVSRSAGALTLDHALSRFVSGVMHSEDRQVLTLILHGQGFGLTELAAGR